MTGLLDLSLSARETEALPAVCLEEINDGRVMMTPLLGTREEEWDRHTAPFPSFVYSDQELRPYPVLSFPFAAGNPFWGPLEYNITSHMGEKKAPNQTWVLDQAGPLSRACTLP